jgi:hypothetical protein
MTNQIQYALLNWVKGGYDVVVPNFFYGWNECDLFRITQSDFVFEYEIKVSRSDFLADFKKSNRQGKKHDSLNTGTGQYCPNRFFYVVPQGLIEKREVPKYAGLIYFKGYSFDVIKPAPLLHRNKIGFEVYRDICRTLSSRYQEQRKRIRQIRNTEFDKEIAAMKREVAKLETARREANNESFLFKAASRKMKKELDAVLTGVINEEKIKECFSFYWRIMNQYVEVCDGRDAS